MSLIKRDGNGIQYIIRSKINFKLMKTRIGFIYVLIFVSFTAILTSMKQAGLNMTYGVSQNDPSQIELKLSKDYSFNYQDFSNVSEAIKISGTYQIVNNTIHLNSNNSKIEFHDKWKLSNDKKVIKSRKGFTFYTLHEK